MKNYFLKRLLSFYFVCSFFSMISIVNATVQQNSEPTTNQDKIEACKDGVRLAKKASSGMDLASYALVGQAVQGTVSTVAEGGGSAKLSHQGNSAIQSTLSTVALKRCMACEEAITACEEVCEADCIEVNPPALDTPKATCETSLEEGLENCTAQQEDCSNACLQGGLSGIQALTSALAAKALADCPEGAENCTDQTTKNEGDKNLKVSAPPGTGAGSSSNMGIHSPWDKTADNKAGEPVIPTEDIANGNNEENITEELFANDGGSNFDTSSLNGSARSNMGSRNSGLNSGAFNHGPNFKGLESSLAGDIAEEEKEEYVKNYPKSHSSANFGKVNQTGNSNSSSYNSGGRRKLRSSNFESRKLAMMDNKKENTFGMGKSKGTIFKQMSRFIQEVCQREVKCP